MCRAVCEDGSAGWCRLMDAASLNTCRASGRWYPLPCFGERQGGMYQPDMIEGLREAPFEVATTG